MTTIFRVVMLAILLALPTSVHAENIDAAKILGQTPETGSLPLWSKPSADARQDLGKAARANERGVMLVGHPKAGHGTAWVISKKHRLLVTNAHVGDILHDNGGKMLAIPNGTAQIHTVEKVWYHPGVRRFSKKNAMFSVRSMDPKEGEVDPGSPDLAVLQLSADGPDLTVEFPLATAEELASLFAQPAAMMGFPGHDTSWPPLGEKAATTFHEGVISRITDFEMSPGAPPAELQFLQYTMAGWGGFSGSPVFLPNGHVAGVHNMARTEKNKKTGEIKFIPHGVRVDCVLEMFVHHGLDDKLPFEIDKTKVSVDRWIKPDARTEKARTDYAKAIASADEASYLVFVTEDYDKGIEKCNQALKLAPNYARAYAIRSNAFGNFRFDNEERLSEKDQRDLVSKAFEDARKAVQLDPSDPYYVLQLCLALNNMGHVTGDKSHNQKVLTIVDELLTANNLTREYRGSAIGRRAVAHANLGEIESAWRDHNEAVRLWPDEPAILETRASFLKRQELGDWGQSDRAKAKKLREKKIETGMKIMEVMEGGAAKKAGLRAGDIIVNVGTKRVRNLEELAAALAEVKGSVDAIVIRAETGKRETIAIAPETGKIGVSVVPADLN